MVTWCFSIVAPPAATAILYLSICILWKWLDGDLGGWGEAWVLPLFITSQSISYWATLPVGVDSIVNPYCTESFRTAVHTVAGNPATASRSPAITSLSRYAVGVEGDETQVFLVASR